MSENIRMTMEKFEKRFEAKLNKFLEAFDDEKISMIIEEFIQQ